MKKNKKKRLERLMRRKHERMESRKVRKVETTGTLSLSTQGFGFVKIIDQNNEEVEIFVPPGKTADGLDGDVVLLSYDPNGKDERGPVGRILEVVERSRETIVGEVIRGRKIKPMSRRSPRDIQLSGSLRGAKMGDWVTIKMLPPSEKGSASHYGEVVDKIGSAGVIANDLDAICEEYQLEPPYTAEQNAKAAAIIPREINRVDMRDSVVITIDPKDAKDFDDAIGLMESDQPDEVVLAVHIADVAAYISPDSEFDEQASLRSFTAYLPGRTLPMLPKELTAKISLVEGQESLAHTVLFYVNPTTGVVRKTERCHSLIVVTKRFDYKQVQRVIDDGKIPRDWDKGVGKVVETSLQVARLWRKERAETERYLELELPETRVLCDEENNKILGISSKVQRESEQLIEEFMLAANVAVAKELHGNSIAGIYRVHPEPKPEKLEEFMALAEDTFHLNCGDLSNRDHINKFISSLPDDELKPLIQGAFLRSLPRALYEAEPSIHFGLGKLLYSHFTSPIRRYPDLCVHQQLWCKDSNVAWKTGNIVTNIAEDCTAKEENNDSAYFAANDRLKLRYLDEQLGKGHGKVYTAIVKKLTPAGLLVDVAEIGVYGVIPKEVFRVRRGRANRDISRRFSYDVGDLLHVELDKIDFINTTAMFKVSEF